MKEKAFYIRNLVRTKFIPKLVRGIIYPSYCVIDGKTYYTVDGVNTSEFLFGQVLNMYLNGNELLPIPPTAMKASSQLMPEIMNAKAEIKAYLNRSISNLEQLWKKIQNTIQKPGRLDTLTSEILFATDQFMDVSYAALRPSNKVIDPISNTMYPVFNVHLTRSEGDNSEFRRDITISNGNETVHLSKQLFDTGAKIPLIMPSLVHRLKLTPAKKVVLSGIGEEQFLTDAVPVTIGIEGHHYDSLAAIFPRLQAITNSEFLIDCQLYNKTLADGVDYRIKA